ncbi:MAG: triose-phosphate isomerase, partial [Bacteroidales bacterium]|nr:triose-phosphate isomerase [Bacteroidales bacterium]
MRKNIVAGNWKMNKTLLEGLELAKDVNSRVSGITPKCQIVLGTPFIHITEVVKTVDSTKIAVAAQNCSDKVSGAYTGEVSAAMVQSTGAKYVILGHSERRAYYGETAATLKDKTDLALENDLLPIFCIGEVLSERESNSHFEVVKKQISESLFHLSADAFGK